MSEQFLGEALELDFKADSVHYFEHFSPKNETKMFRSPFPQMGPQTRPNMTFNQASAVNFIN